MYSCVCVYIYIYIYMHLYIHKTFIGNYVGCKEAMIKYIYIHR